MHSAVWKALKNFKIKRAKETRRNQIFFQNVKKKKKYLRSSKYLKTTVELTFTTQKANTCSLWTALTGNTFCWVNLIQKFKIISLSWNIVPRLIQICRIPWRCLLFLFSIGQSFFGRFGPKDKNCQFELKFCNKLIWTCRIM